MTTTKKIIFNTLAALAITTAPLQAQTVNVQQETTRAAEHTTINPQDIVEFSASFKGVPYKYGASSPKAFDCSGFTSYIFRQFEIHLPRSAKSQYRFGKKIDRKNLKPGDLVFFSGRKVSKQVGHVGIVSYVGDDHFRFIHASVHRGITESNINETYYTIRYVGARRVIDG